MPSAFFTMDKKLNSDGDVASVTFYGGGCGHGVGMSQNGAKGMIDAGFSVDEVLGHYYPGTAVMDISKVS
jgi:stage II sporulation protein D